MVLQKSETSSAMSVLNSLLKAQERKKTGAAPAGAEGGGGGGGKKGKGKKVNSCFVIFIDLWSHLK